MKIMVFQEGIPFDDVGERRELYELVVASGMSGADFYDAHFGFETPIDDRCDVG
jgi:hypothetical protein